MLFLPCCPRRILTSFTELALEWWVWVDEFHMTPMKTGVSFQEVDPRFWDAMMVLKREQRRIEREEIERSIDEAKNKTST